MCHGTDLRHWEGIWKHGIIRGGPHAKRNEIFLKLPDGFRPTQWGKYFQWEPTIYKFDRPCIAHIDTEVAMSTGCRYYTDCTVGAILSSNANIPTCAILKITTNRGETLAYNAKAQAAYIERQVLHNERWTKHLCDQALHQMPAEPKARPAARASRWKPPVIVQDPCWQCSAPHNNLRNYDDEAKYGVGKFCSLKCRDDWHHANPFVGHGERKWPDSIGKAIDVEITPDMLARLRESEPTIRKDMDAIAEAKRITGHALGQADALPSADVRTLNKAQDRAASAGTSARPVPLVDLEGSDIVQCSVCDKIADMDVHIGNNYFCNVNHEQEFYLAVCKRVSDEIDAKAVEREEGDDSAFPPLPNAGAEPVTWHPPPTLLDRAEKTRNQLLEMPGWTTPGYYS